MATGLNVDSGLVSATLQLLNSNRPFEMSFIYKLLTIISISHNNDYEDVK